LSLQSVAIGNQKFEKQIKLDVKLKKPRVAAVSYLNTLPFVFGLNRYDGNILFELFLAPPVKCAQMLMQNEVDIALVPVGSLPMFSHVEIVSAYCLGAKGVVDSVFLLSNTPLHLIKRVFNDLHSYTSNALVKVLSEHFWQLNVEIITPKIYPPPHLQHGDAMIAIGDKAFDLKTNFEIVIDLSMEWFKFSGKPFVFAVWISKEKMHNEVVINFNQALQFGVSNIKESLVHFNTGILSADKALQYLEKNIKYDLNNDFIEGMELFLQYVENNCLSRIHYAHLTH